MDPDYPTEKAGEYQFLASALNCISYCFGVEMVVILIWLDTSKAYCDIIRGVTGCRQYMP